MPVRPLLLIVLLAGAVAPGVICDVAHAQQPAAPFAAPGLVEFLPPGEIVGDGSTETTLHVLALQATGQPMTGLRPRVTATEGNAQNWTELGNGLYSLTFVPAKVDAAKSVTLRLRGKNAAKENVEADYELAVVPPMSKRVTVAANPPQVVLGQDAEATLSFTLEGGAGQPLQGADLVIRPSSGEVSNVTDMGGGRFTARYVAPKVNYPHLAIVTVADRRDPSRTYGYAVVPLMGKTDYPVKTQPNASVILKIAGREFGPVAAAADGRALVPIVVPPGVQSATLVTILNGQTSEETLDLRIPETVRVTMMPVQPGLPGDAVAKMPVRFVVRAPEGQPDAGAQVQFTATAGTFGAARHEGDGIYVAEYTPPMVNAAQQVTLTATVQGSTVQTASQTVELVPVRPASVTLTSDPAVLPPGVQAFKVFAKVTGPDGKGLAGRQLLVNAVGAQQAGATSDLGNGDYRADFSGAGTGSAEVLATVQTPATGNPLRQVVLLPVREWLPNDGISSAAVTIVTVDEFGYPVPNVPVTLALDGDGQLPTTATTNANGLAQVFYTAGRAADLVRITATAGGHAAGAAVLQGPSGIATPDLPLSGSAANRDLARKWSGIVTALHIAREGAAPVAAVVPPTPPTAVVTTTPAASAGPVTALQVSASPASASAGSTVTLAVKATDAKGVGVAGQKLELISSVGSFGAVTDLGGGDYQVVLTIPADATGEAKVSIADEAGNAASFLKIPLTGAPPSAWGATGGATTTVTTTTPEAPAGGTATATTPTSGIGATTTTTTTTTPPAPVIPRPAGEFPWLRAGASYVVSSYRYEQLPLVTDGPLLPVPMRVGGDSGGNNATPQGFELHGRAFPEDLKYIGFDANLRMAYYSVTTEAFQGQAAPDWLVDFSVEAVPRFPFEAGGSQFHAGLRAGFKYSDFIVFKGCIESGCTVEYQTLALPGFGLGLEFGAELPMGLFFVAGLEEGVYVATPYSTAMDATLGYQLNDSVYADLGLEAVTRRITVIGDSTGTEYGKLSDGHMIIKLGVGYSM